MTKKSLNIPILTLNASTQGNLSLRRIVGRDHKTQPVRGLHRDNYFVLLLQTEGTSEFMVDFEKVVLQGTGILCIPPGSIHQYITGQNMEGWLLGVGAEYINDGISATLNGYRTGQAVQLDKKAATIRQLSHIAQAINDSLSADAGVLGYLATAFAAVFAQEISRQPSPLKGSRQAELAAVLRQLIQQYHRQEKSPKWYAAKCHLSLGYLNECAKWATGYSVSKLIVQQSILEAKRMLAQGDVTFKEISYQLGYEDPAYFNRVFYTSTGMRPSAFGKMYRK